MMDRMIRSAAAALILMFAAMQCAAAERTGDAATVLGVLSDMEESVTIDDFSERFGAGFEMKNVGGDVYRNFDWVFPLVSADSLLTLHVGFDYGRIFDWSMTVDFKERSDDQREFFVKLCKGLELETGHISPAIRLAPPVDVDTLSAFYPAPLAEMIEVSAIRAGLSDKVVITPSNRAASRYYMIRMPFETKLMAWPDLEAKEVRIFEPGHTTICLDEREVVHGKGKGAHKVAWLRVQERDGQVGWLMKHQAEAIGVTTIEGAFAPRSADVK